MSVPDPTQSWRGHRGDGQPLGYIGFTDCSFRAMDSHGVHNPTGYPQILVDRLTRRGIALRGRNIYIPRTDDLPRTEDELRSWWDLDGEPGVVLVHTGSQCGLRTALGLRPTVQAVRDRVARSLGRRAVTAYRWWLPLVGRVTRPGLPLQDAEEVVRFRGLVASVWPRAQLIVMPPFMPTAHSPWSQEICGRVANDLRDVCEREGLEFLDPNPAIERLDSSSARCTNGYNLTWSGHEAMADALEPRFADAATASGAGSGPEAVVERAG